MELCALSYKGQVSLDERWPTCDRQEKVGTCFFKGHSRLMEQKAEIETETPDGR